MAIDWNILIQSAVETTIRQLPSIIIALGTVTGVNWRQNVKTRKIVKDGLQELAREAGKWQGFKETIPLARQDRQEMIDLLKGPDKP